MIIKMRIPLKFNARAFAAFIFIALSFCVSLAHAQQQSPLLDTSRNDLLLKNSQLIDSKISDFVRDDILAKRGVKGMAMTVVRPDGEVEFGTWGVWNERNDEVGPNVRLSASYAGNRLTIVSVADVIWHWIMFKSISRDVNRHRHGRLCKRKELYPSSVRPGIFRLGHEDEASPPK
jgi:hypothetical protein